VGDDARAVVFGRDAAAYEEVRPSYPSAAIDYLLGLVDAGDAVEVGAGTGKATEAIAHEGLTITCLEPSPQMAEILQSKALPGVDVVVSKFEDWDAGPGSVDLVYAAQAWHWVDRETGLDRALTLLRPGGVLALLWNVPLDRYARHLDAYQSHAPHLLAERDARIKRRDHHDWCSDMAEAGFVETDRFTHSWSEELTADRYRALYSTYSDHMMLEEPTRTRLLDQLTSDVETWGGTVEVEYRTEVFSGCR
jgi:SAM-dependent methyltransferase